MCPLSYRKFEEILFPSILEESNCLLSEIFLYIFLVPLYVIETQMFLQNQLGSYKASLRLWNFSMTKLGSVGISHYVSHQGKLG